MKNWKQSKTVIFNSIAAIVALGSVIGGLEITPKITMIAAAVVAIGNIVLRFLTSKPII